MDEHTRAYDRSRSLDDKPFRSACYAPFGSLYFNTNGNVLACCKSTHHVLGNIARQRLPEIWRGEALRTMRAQLRNFEFGDPCRFCRWQVESGHADPHSKIFDDLRIMPEADAWPTRMDFTLSNTCNLACQMCYGTLSSTIRAQRDLLPALPRVYGDEFFDDLRAFLPHLQRATFMGGEPFLAAENYRIWDMMLADGLSFPCSVITNGTQWGPRIERVLEALPVHVSVSIDGVSKEVVESIRINAKFDVVMENTRRFLDYTKRRGTRMSLMFCLMRQNWFEFGGYLELAESMGVDVDMNVVVDPADCSLYSMSTDELSRVIDKLEQQGDSEGLATLPRNGHVWRTTITDLRNSLDAGSRRCNIGGAQPTSSTDRTSSDPLTTAWAHVAGGRGDEALEELRTIDATDARHYESLLCAAQAHRVMGRSDDVLRTLDEAIELSPRSPHARLQRGWLLVDQGRPRDALEDAEAALSVAEKAAAAPHLGQARRLLASVYTGIGRREDALGLLHQIPETDPGAYAAATTSAWISRELGRFDDADAAIERALRIAPDRAQALVERAWLRSAQGRLNEGIEAAETALALVPEERASCEAPSVQHPLAQLLLANGAPERALAHADELLSRRPGEGRFWHLRAQIHFELGRHADALADVRKAMELAPDSAEITAFATTVLGEPT